MIIDFRSVQNQQSNEFSVQIRSSPNPYVLLIGPAGAGKTTLSKRVVLSTFQSKRYAFFSPLYFVDPQQPIDLKYFLFKLGMMYFSGDIIFNENQMNVAFVWLLANQHKVTIVLDGLDQAQFTLQDCKAPTEIDIHKKYFPSELLLLILSRKLLPGVRLVVTSRSHSILNFDGAIQPNFVLYLDDLSEESMKTLIRFYLKNDDTDPIIRKLLEKSPRVQQLQVSYKNC